MTIPSVVSGDVAVGRIPSQTYRVDFTKGRITSDRIDNVNAVVQAAVKALLTVRYRSIIYSQYYGYQGEDLIGKNPSLVRTELPRMIREALIYDDRINGISNLTLEFDIPDIARAEFTLNTIFGDAPVSIDLVF